MKNLLFSLAVFACSIGVADAQAPPRIDRAAVTAALTQRANEVANRLALTPAQRQQAAPVIRNSLSRRWSALTSAWADGTLDDQEKARLSSQFETERRGVVVTLRGFLSEQQVQTFQRLQAEETARFQDELRRGVYSRPR